MISAFYENPQQLYFETQKGIITHAPFSTVPYIFVNIFTDQHINSTVSVKFINDHPEQQCNFEFKHLRHTEIETIFIKHNTERQQAVMGST